MLSRLNKKLDYVESKISAYGTLLSICISQCPISVAALQLSLRHLFARVSISLLVISCSRSLSTQCTHRCGHLDENVSATTTTKAFRHQLHFSLAILNSGQLVFQWKASDLQIGGQPTSPNSRVHRSNSSSTLPNLLKQHEARTNTHPIFFFSWRATCLRQARGRHWQIDVFLPGKSTFNFERRFKAVPTSDKFLQAYPRRIIIHIHTARAVRSGPWVSIDFYVQSSESSHIHNGTKGAVNTKFSDLAQRNLILYKVWSVTLIESLSFKSRSSNALAAA